MSPSDQVLTLAQQLAASLTMPIFIVDTEGFLLYYYYNKAAESVLGRRFEETGKLSAGVWSRIFIPTDEHGAPLLPETLPLMIALTEHRPTHDRFWISGIDNVRRHIEVAAFPLTDKAGQYVGAIAIFWEMKET